MSDRNHRWTCQIIFSYITVRYTWRTMYFRTCIASCGQDPDVAEKGIIENGSSCQYCGGGFLASDLTFDHVVPRSKGGRTTWTNVVAACSPCNLRKGNKLSGQCNMKPLAKPIAPNVWQLQENGRAFPPNYLHESWRDYLYWDSELQTDD